MDLYDKILAALKTKFIGVPSGVLERRARKMDETVEKEEGVQTAVDGVKLEDLFEAHGDYRAGQATDTAKEKAKKEAIKEYEETHKIKDGKPVKSGDDDKTKNKIGDDDKEKPAWVDDLVTTVTGLKDEVTTLKNEKVQNQRAETIAGKLKNAGIPEKLHKRFSVTDDASEEEIDTAVTEYKQELNDLGLSAMREPGGGGGSDTFESDLDDWTKSKEEETKEN